MIEFNEFSLSNGLNVIHHEDRTKSSVVLNILYNVGARDEDPNRTGFAHLFEHLMFEGSENISNFDEELQKAGGTNNAFTSNDLTNYYIEVPVQNIETAFWLESDRMNQLAFSQESLNVQKGVVIEEFKQRYLNQPFGQAYIHLRDTAYKVHPYRWATIGKNTSHIEEATLDEVIEFYNTYYHPNNAIVCVAGNIPLERCKELCDHWFGDIAASNPNPNEYPLEPKQDANRHFFAPQPNSQRALYLGFHKPSVKNQEHHTGDIVASLLGGGKESFLYKQLVEQKNIFQSISCYNSEELDPGLFYITGKVSQNYTVKTAYKELIGALNSVQLGDFVFKEEKIKGKVNKINTAKAYQDSNLLNRAMALCFFKNQGNIHWVNQQIEKYNNVEVNNVKSFINKYLIYSKHNTVYYDELTE